MAKNINSSTSSMMLAVQKMRRMLGLDEDGCARTAVLSSGKMQSAVNGAKR